MKTELTLTKYVLLSKKTGAVDEVLYFDHCLSAKEQEGVHDKNAHKLVRIGRVPVTAVVSDIEEVADNG